MQNSHTIILRGESQRQLAKRYIDQAPLNFVVSIKEMTRTTEQNNRFWAMLTDVSRSKPDGIKKTPADWKGLFMHAFGYEIQFEMGLNGNPFPKPYSSSNLKVSEMRDIMEFISAWGSERGVQWSEPEFKDYQRNDVKSC